MIADSHPPTDAGPRHIGVGNRYVRPPYDSSATLCSDCGVPTADPLPSRVVGWKGEADPLKSVTGVALAHSRAPTRRGLEKCPPDWREGRAPMGIATSGVKGESEPNEYLRGNVGSSV